MRSKFDCFGPGFFAGFFKVGLPNPGFFGYVPGCPNPGHVDMTCDKFDTHSENRLPVGNRLPDNMPTRDTIASHGLTFGLAVSINKCPSFAPRNTAFNKHH